MICLSDKKIIVDNTKHDKIYFVMTQSNCIPKYVKAVQNFKRKIVSNRIVIGMVIDMVIGRVVIGAYS